MIFSTETQRSQRFTEKKCESFPPWEDGQRKRIKHAAENFSIVRKIALHLLKKDSGKESLRSKRLKAAWNKDFPVELIKF